MYIAARAAFPTIRNGGSITLTNGILAMRPWKGWSAVSAVAGAVESLTRGFALEMAPIRVNTVMRRHDQNRVVEWDERSRSRGDVRRTGRRNCQSARVGERKDVAETYLYLMKSEFTTGQIVVDRWRRTDRLRRSSKIIKQQTPGIAMKRSVKRVAVL